MKSMKIVLVAVLVCFGSLAFGQKYITDKSEVSFYSEAPIEDIEAHNQKATSIFDTESGAIVFSIPINEFQFEKSLMQEHFNEKYLESEKYPKATFQGKVTNFSLEPGDRDATATGNLEIHGVSREVTIKGTFEFKDEKIFINASFPVKLEDYKIKIPKLLFKNIAEIVEVKVNLEYKRYEK